MLDMLTYCLNILWNAVREFPSAFSQNWFSMLIPLAAFAIREGRRLQKAGWRWDEVKQIIKRDAYWIAALYALVFSWVIVRAAYQDHHALATQVQSLNGQSQSQADSATKLLNSTREDLLAQIANLRVDCGIKEGMNRTLQIQNRDQQNSINNCQTQALKLLTPIKLAVTILQMDSDHISSTETRANYLLVSNRGTTSPFAEQVQCDRDIMNHGFKFIPPESTFQAADRLTDKRHWQFILEYPQLSPLILVQVSLTHAPPDEIHCDFESNQ